VTRTVKVRLADTEGDIEIEALEDSLILDVKELPGLKELSGLIELPRVTELTDVNEFKGVSLINVVRLPRGVDELDMLPESLNLDEPVLL